MSFNNVNEASKAIFEGLSKIKLANIPESDLIKLKLEEIINPILEESLELSRTGNTEYIRCLNRQKSFLILNFIKKDNDMIEFLKRKYKDDLENKIFTNNIIDILSLCSIVIKISYNEFIDYVKSKYNISKKVDDYISGKFKNQTVDLSNEPIYFDLKSPLFKSL